MSITQTILDVVAAPLRPIAVAGLLLGGLAACEGNTAANADDVDMSKPRAAAGTDFTDGYEEIDAGWVMGAKDAPVTLEEYGSFTCGGCGAFYMQILPKIKEQFIDTGLVRFEFYSYIRNPADMLATQVADCAGEEKFKGIKNLYFSSQYQWLNSSNPMDYVAQMARKAGINSAAFRQCTSDSALRTQITKDTQQFNKNWGGPDGSFSTPTVVVNDRKLESGLDEELIIKSIEAALRS